mgnify:CR=1 FL=1
MIEIKNDTEISLIEKASKIAIETLILVKESTKPGTVTEELNELAEKNIAKNKAKPAFLGYRGYPKSICVSINDEVIHGIPSKSKVINEGDVVSVDIGVIYDGYYGDAAITFIVGKARSPMHIKLVKVCEEALYRTYFKRGYDTCN